MPELGDAALATIFSAVVAALVGWATNRNSSRASSAAAKVTAEAVVKSSRNETEEQAFERAKGYYTDVMDRQHAEHLEDQEEIARLKADIRTLQDEKRVDRRKIGELEERVESLEHDNAKLCDDLLVATRLLEKKYPDES